MYIDAILTVYNKYNNMVTYHFNNEKGFKAALDKACGTFINKNTVTKMGSDSKKCPELLANYCHLLLRKSKKNLQEDELEYALEQSVVVFRYIDEKDVFEKYYKIRLAERLVRYSYSTFTHACVPMNPMHMTIYAIFPFSFYRLKNCQHQMMPKHQ